MNNKPFQNEDYLDEDSFSIIDFLEKYTKYWRWFVLSCLAALFIAFLYMRYAQESYVSTAKVKIIDQSKQTDIASDVQKEMWGLSTINLENEIEVFKSHLLLRRVVTDLNLDVNYFYRGFFKDTQIWKAPFVVQKFISADSLVKSKYYEVQLKDSVFHIADFDDNKYEVAFDNTNHSAPGLPFSIELPDDNPMDVGLVGNKYLVMISPVDEVTNWLMKDLHVEPANKKSDILLLWILGESIERSEAILDKVVEKFNQDGVEDKQAISKRTLDFIDERFIYLTGELDSIELGKQDFKQDNSLAYIQEDATTILRRKSEAEEEVFNLETQLSLSKLLRSAVVKEAEFGLLPPDIGLDNTSINSLVAKYNELSSERTRLQASMPVNHPTMRSLMSQLRSGKENILKTLEVNQRQIATSLSRLKSERAIEGAKFSRIPEKEKMLRAIERQQSIKENLFLLLLSKREEAAIKNAITAPVIKIIDFAQSVDKPVSPNKVMVYPIALFLGLIVPFLILFVRFTLDTKIHGRSDLERLKTRIPVMAEIPYYDDADDTLAPEKQSLVTESYRILSTNILNQRHKGEGMVVFVTSSIKGEGKTSTSVNLAKVFAGINKKVLLLGCDLRDPKLHNHFSLQKDNIGISNFIADTKMDWKQGIRKTGGGILFPDICLSGTETFNPTEILANDRFELFIEKAKSEYDFVIVDTAPMLFLSDTRLISKFADLTLYLLRANFTEKRLIEFTKELNRTQELENMFFIVNAVGSDGDMEKYNYGYGYQDETISSKSTFEKVIDKAKIVAHNTKKGIISLFSKSKGAIKKMRASKPAEEE